MKQRPRINSITPIVSADGTMTQQFRELLNEITQSLPLTGTGSPEGVVDAFQFSTYIANDGTSGSLLYVKKLTDIAGDTTMGWVAV